MSKVLIAAIAFALLTPVASAQDARTVTEPVVPPSCTVLDAHLSAVKQGDFNTLAPADEAKLDTSRIQDAIDACTKGKSVVLRARGRADAFLSGPLKLRGGVTLVVDKGTTLFASIDPKVFEIAPGSCGIVNNVRTAGCRPLMAVDGVSGAGVMGEGVIDGRGGIRQLGGELSAWEIAQLSDRGRKALSRLIIANHANNFTLYRITLRNSPNFHVSYNAGNGFTVWGVKIDAPHRFPRSAHPLARNTDGIDPGNGSKNITITHSFIRTGDDNVAIKGGLTNMTVSHNHFYWGHGMSIGSQTHGGISRVRVFDLTLDGTDSGIRIKSSGDRGGLVQDVAYDDICIRNSANPINLTTHYEDGNGASTRPPTFRNITLHNVTIAGGGALVFDGFDKDHRVQAILDGVFLADAGQLQAKYDYTFGHADVTIGKGGSNLSLPAGTDATLTGTPTAGSGSPACAARFVPFPE